MISMLRGNVVEKAIGHVLLDVQGVGYEISIPLSTYDRLPREGEEATLKTVLNVREDAMQLFGFLTTQEKILFTVVTSSVSGVGPKTALDILSSMNIDNFCSYIVNQDVKAISTIKGIGKKTAERMVVELKSKVGEISPAVALGGRPSEVDQPDVATAFTQEAEDAIAGLITLGIKPDSARKCIREVIEGLDGETFNREKLIRMALTRMNQ